MIKAEELFLRAKQTVSVRIQPEANPENTLKVTSKLVETDKNMQVKGKFDVEPK